MAVGVPESDLHLRLVLGNNVYQGVRKSRVLMVGSGGIGCELAKDLVQTGYRDLEFIDLDTIDVSNLNRQFLFRPEHVGKAKASVAAETVYRFAPAGSKICAHHSNIMLPKFSRDYFAGFDLVINGLDNAAARRHVNRMALAARRPLVEAGSTGYNGQAQEIRRGVTECYECFPPPAPKSYPICTIRQTPDKPVHCIVWAQEAFKLLFGDQDASMLVEPEEGSVYMANCKPPTLPVEAGAGSSGDAAAAYADAPAAAASAGEGSRREAAVAWAAGVFEGLFHNELAHKLRNNPDAFKTAKRKPTPLVLRVLLGDEAVAPQSSSSSSSSSSSAAAASSASSSSASVEPPAFDVVSARRAAAEASSTSWAGICQRVPSARECACKFVDATSRMALDRLDAFGGLSFDKDDGLAMEWVTATANLRALTFGIPLTSPWDCKSIAGNIIPAIATTNAIVAALETGIALRITARALDEGKKQQEEGALGGGKKGGESESVSAGSSHPLLSQVSLAPPDKGVHVAVAKALSSLGACVRPGACRGPRASCFVCGSNEVELRIDTEARTLRFLVHDVLMRRMGFVAPLLDNNVEFSFIEEREEDEDDEEYEQKVGFLDVPLKDLVGGGIQGGTVLSVTDMRQDLTVRIFVRHATSGDLNPAGAGAKEGGLEAGGVGPKEQEGEEEQEEVLFEICPVGSSSPAKAKAGGDAGTGSEGPLPAATAGQKRAAPEEASGEDGGHDAKRPRSE